ncbi:MAG: RCC1 domain-containing protein [Candidatus Limnocylindrales bacterium]
MRFAVLRWLFVVGVLAGSGTVANPEVAAGRASAPVGHAVSILSVGAGAYAGYAVLSDGHVWAWGDDLEGQIGNTGPWSSRTLPVEVQGLSGATLVAGGAGSAYALEGDGTVWAWGDDSQGELADGRFTLRQLPGLVPNLTAVTTVAAGAFAAYAIRRDGTAWAWGDDSFGQLGTGSGQGVSTTPQELAGLTDVVAIAAGTSDGYALLHDGTVWTWGDNSLGQLGGAECGSTPASRHGTCLASSIPRQIPDLTGVVAIAAGGDSGYALRRDGTLWAWGDDDFGELGNGVVRLDERVPVRVKGLRHVVAIAAGSGSGYALLRDGTVWAWGRGDYGQLGDGSTSKRSLPGPVKGLTRVVEVVGGGDMAFALQSDGELWAWGANAYGQLGNGSVTSRDLPVRVLRLASLAPDPARNRKRSLGSRPPVADVIVRHKLATVA